MPAYGFKAWLVPKLEDGSKHHTFRVPRKDGRLARPKQIAYWYVAMRTKQCRKVGERPIYQVLPIFITENGIDMRKYDVIAYLEWQAEYYSKLYDCPLAHDAHCDNVKCYPVGLEFSDIIARNDGFADFAGMKTWMLDEHKKLPVFGFLTCWNPYVNTTLFSQSQ